MTTPEPTDTEGLETTKRKVLHILRTHLTLPADADVNELYAIKIADHIHKNFVLKANIIPSPAIERARLASTSELEDLVMWIANMASAFVAGKTFRTSAVRNRLQAHIRRVTLEAQSQEIGIIQAMLHRPKNYDTMTSMEQIIWVIKQAGIIGSHADDRIAAISKELQEMEGEQHE